jgi:hypothetical protein
MATALPGAVAESNAPPPRPLGASQVWRSASVRKVAGSRALSDAVQAARTAGAAQFIQRPPGVNRARAVVSPAADGAPEHGVRYLHQKPVEWGSPSSEVVAPVGEPLARVASTRDSQAKGAWVGGASLPAWPLEHATAPSSPGIGSIEPRQPLVTRPPSPDRTVSSPGIETFGANVHAHAAIDGARPAFQPIERPPPYPDPLTSGVSILRGAPKPLAPPPLPAPAPDARSLRDEAAAAPATSADAQCAPPSSSDIAAEHVDYLVDFAASSEGKRRARVALASRAA